MKKQKINGYCETKKKNNSYSKNTGLYSVTLEVKILAYGDPDEIKNDPKSVGTSLWNVDDTASAFSIKLVKKITKITQINNDPAFDYLNEFDGVFVSDSGRNKIEKLNNEDMFIEPDDATVSDLIDLEKIC